MVPQFLDRKLNVTIPPGLRQWFWSLSFQQKFLAKSMPLCKNPYLGYHLHTTNGFLMAIGFALIDLLTAATGFPLKCHRICSFLHSVFQWLLVLWILNSAWTGFWNGYAEGLDRTGHQLCEAESYRCNVPIHVDVQSLAVNGETWIWEAILILVLLIPWKIWS